jgi:hypothetical protein
LHAGPSVSSHITHFYPLGTELKLIGYAQGWFQVSDPATLRQGWIYEKYYLQAIPGPGQTRFLVHDIPTTRVASVISEPEPVNRIKKRPSQKFAKPKREQRIRLARDESVASIMEGPLGEIDDPAHSCPLGGASRHPRIGDLRSANDPKGLSGAASVKMEFAQLLRAMAILSALSLQYNQSAPISLQLATSDSERWLT